MKKFSLILLMLLLSTILTFAQSSTGRLVGSVAGPDGVLPGAAVEIRDEKTGKVINLTANEDGNFTVPSIEVGTYTVTVTAQGFKTSTQTGVKIDIGREYSLDVKLEVGQITENVTVTAGADIVNSTNQTISQTVSQKELLELPLNGRNPLSLVALQAGNNNAGINGARTSSTNYTRDGVNVQDIYIRNGFVTDTPTTDNTGEFTVQAANTGAETGFGSSQVQLFTPRGGKEYHGALFAYNRNSAFSANNFFNNRQGRFVATDTAVIQGRAQVGDLRAPVPFLNRNQFGGKFSGPLPFFNFGEGDGPIFRRDKTFFFFNTEKFILRQQAIVTRTVLTPEARQGIFRYKPTSAPLAGQCISFVNGVCSVNVLTGQGLTGAIPATQNGVLALDPTIQTRFITPLPQGNRPDLGDGLNTIGYQFNQGDPEDRKEYTFRFDGEVNNNNSISATFRYNRTTDARTDIDTTFSPTALANTDAPVKFFRVGWVRSSGNLTNEFIFGMNLAPVAFRNTNLPTATPFVTIPLVTNPENYFRDQGRESNFYTWMDNASYIWGNHTLRFGGEYQKQRVTSFLENGVGTPTYAIAGTGNTVALRLTQALFPGGAAGGGISAGDRTTADNLRYLLGGVIGGGSQTVNVTSQTSGYVAGEPFVRKLRFDALALYITDAWKIRPNFTLNYGLRYERYTPLRVENALYLEPVVVNDDPLASVLSTTGTINYVGTNAGEPGRFTKPDNNNFGPSVGFAYSFGGKGFLKYIFGGEESSVLRGGISIKYNNDEFFRSQENALANNAGLQNTAVALQNGSPTLNARLNSLPAVVAPTFVQPPFSFANQLNTFPFATGSNASLFVIDPNLQLQRQTDMSLSYVRQFGRNTALQFSYVGTRSNQLVRTIDYGQVDITNNGFGADYVRAFNNFRAAGNIFGTSNGTATGTLCATCQKLTVIPLLPTASINFIAGGITTGAPADDVTTLIANGPAFTNGVKFLLNPSFSPVNILSNGGRFDYNSLQIEFRQRLSQGIIINANYTFQKILTDVQDDGVNQTRVSPLLDINNPDLNYSRAPYDTQWTFNLTGIFDLPFGKGKRFLNGGGLTDTLFGGWSFGAVIAASPRGPLLFGDARGTLNRAGRSGFQTGSSILTSPQIAALLGHYEVNGVIYGIDPSVICPSGRAADSQFLTCPNQVFLQNMPFSTGNIQRYNFNGPTFHQEDVSLQKNFRLGGEGSHRIVVRAEAFNVFNVTRFGSPNTTITSTSFGRITAASAARVFQFGLRYEF
jgi:hypothetical protein